MIYSIKVILCMAYNHDMNLSFLMNVNFNGLLLFLLLFREGELDEI